MGPDWRRYALDLWDAPWGEQWFEAHRSRSPLHQLTASKPEHGLYRMLRQ
jgi:hypothetical protein